MLLPRPGVAALDDFPVTLGETGFAGDGTPFAGDTSAGGAAGSGKWGGRWSAGKGSAAGGTVGVAADASIPAVLGAFTARAQRERPADSGRPRA